MGLELPFTPSPLLLPYGPSFLELMWLGKTKIGRLQGRQDAQLTAVVLKAQHVDLILNDNPFVTNEIDIVL